VRILTNGIGSIDASSASPDHAVAVEPAQAKRIEVLRGASLLRYGSSGSGGIVNVIDGRIPSEFPDGNTDVAVRIGASSVDSAAEAAAMMTKITMRKKTSMSMKKRTTITTMRKRKKKMSSSNSSKRVLT